MMHRPEDVFDEFFHRLDPASRKIYKGKKDLNTIAEPMRSFLVAMREQFIAALLSNKNHVRPFYFDYVESDIANALAFDYEGYSFVGITIPLLDEMAATTSSLCRSEAIVELLNPHKNSELVRALYATLIRLQLLFTVSHEYAHHVNGDMIPHDSQSVFLNEIADSGETGSLEQQASEIDADFRAAHYVLSDLIIGDSRRLVVEALKLDSEPISTQDEVLFLCFVVAAGSFFCVRKPIVLDSTRNIYHLTHPPQAARMAALMSFASSWGRSRETS